jgi:hypothetical protein
VQGQLVAFVSVINRQREQQQSRKEANRENPMGERDAIHAREINQM